MKTNLTMAGAILLLAMRAAGAAETDAGTEESWAVHGQLTNLTQKHDSFRSPYSGTNSLDANGRTEETTDLTLYAGAHLWQGAQLWLNPEIDQGFGLSNTVGVAGFPSGEAYKVGSNHPYLRLPRAFLRQVFPLGGEAQAVEAGANQLAGSTPADNVTLTVGKFSVTDIFDTNSYAHDPRSDFMNWSLIDSGAVDYAADAWGFTYGAALEWTQDWWTWRAGVFQLSPVPNGKIVKVEFGQYSLMSELEGRYQWRGHAGKAKLLAFANHGRMGSYLDAVRLGAASGSVPEIAPVRQRAWRPGFALNLEQELAADLGAFLRLSANDGAKEAYEFTEINRSLAGGLAWKGARWSRPDDTVGVAAVVNQLSGAAQQYFSNGGIGILIGDGALHYGPEQIVETYYAAKLAQGVSATLDYQHINHPAYNRDRGPVSVYSLRLHAEF